MDLTKRFSLQERVMHRENGFGSVVDLTPDSITVAWDEEPPDDDERQVRAYDEHFALTLMPEMTLIDTGTGFSAVRKRRPKP